MKYKNLIIGCLIKPFLDYTQLFDQLKTVAGVHFLWGPVGVIRLTVQQKLVDLRDRLAP